MARPGGWMAVCVEAKRSPSLEPASPLGGLVLLGKGPQGVVRMGTVSAFLSGMLGWGDLPQRVDLEQVSDTLPIPVYPPLEALRGPGPRSS